MLASILFCLTVFHYAMSVIAPLLRTIYGRQTPRMGFRVLLTWSGMLCGAVLFGVALRALGGVSLILLTSAEQNMYAIATWAAFFGGLGIVIWSFVKGTRLRKQMRVTVTT